VRDELLVSDCTGYATTPVSGCSANFTKGSSAAADAQAASDTQQASEANAANNGKANKSGLASTGAPLERLLNYLIGPA
jgi:hypothetical protein